MNWAKINHFGQNIWDLTEDLSEFLLKRWFCIVEHTYNYWNIQALRYFSRISINIWWKLRNNDRWVVHRSSIDPIYQRNINSIPVTIQIIHCQQNWLSLQGLLLLILHKRNNFQARIKTLDNPTTKINID